MFDVNGWERITAAGGNMQSMLKRAESDRNTASSSGSVERAMIYFLQPAQGLLPPFLRPLGLAVVKNYDPTSMYSIVIWLS
jgi:hypothetical protein